MMPQRRRKPRFETVPVARIRSMAAREQFARSQERKPKRILSISYSPAAMVTREMILKRAGYEVHSTANLQEALRWCAEGEFDLVIVGHSLPPEQRAEAASEVRKTCSAQVLVLRVNGQLEVPEAANHIYDDPEGLVRTVRRLLGD